MARKDFNELRAQVEARPGAAEQLAELRAETLEEIRRYELRAGVTLRQYLEALGARLEFVAVFDDEDRRVPVRLGKEISRVSTNTRRISPSMVGDDGGEASGLYQGSTRTP